VHAASAEWRKQHEQDRHERHRAGCERLDKGAADCGERKAHLAEPPRAPHESERAFVEDDFLSLAHRRSLCIPLRREG
jgi:hypothetical protein